MRPKQSRSSSSKRDAVHLKSGEPVAHSGPGLKGPTLPPTVDRTSAACLIPPQGAERPGVDILQPKSGRGLGQSPMSAEGALPLLDTADLRKLIAFFELLDTWERRSHAPQIM